MNTNGKLEFANAIVQTWSPKWYDSLKNKLMLMQIFASEYQGEISSRGDTVNVLDMKLAPAQTLTNDKQKFEETEIQIGKTPITVNRQTVHAVKITNLADLQSEAYMEKLRSEMIYELFIKAEQEILAEYLAKVPSGNKIAPTVASDMDAKDVAKMRVKASRALLPEDNRFALYSPEYYGDLLTKNQIISADFVNSKPILENKIPNILGFNTLENTLLGTDFGIFFHKSALHTVMQRGINIEVVSKKANNELAFMLVADFVWDMKVLDTKRMFQISG